jgi:hypothetical protein
MQPMIQTFSNNDAVFQDNDNATFTQLELLSHGLNSIKMNFNNFPAQQNHQI